MEQTKPNELEEVGRILVDHHLKGSLPEHIDFVQAKNFTKSNRAKGSISLVVIHDMEGTESKERAELCAARFAGGPGVIVPKASAHYAIDFDSIVGMVKEKDVAWHAPGANHNGIGLEHAGFARQTAAQWKDEYGMHMLALSAGLTARICKRYALPTNFVDAVGLTRLEQGITTHAEVTKAFRKSTHMDPGPNFPLAWYLSMVQYASQRI